MRVVVTGGAGFIGSHVAEAFLEAGHHVLILDDLSNGKEENIPGKAEFSKTDIMELDTDKIFRAWKTEAVCHHAAQISVRNSVKDPIIDLRKNVIGTVKVLEACRSSGCSRFIFASTGGALYGDQTSFPAPETHPTYPTSPYGISKLAAEKYLYFYRKQYGLRGIVLRYSNVYGPRQDPLGEAGVVAIFCRRLLTGETLIINGDGLQTRDFVYVKDVAKANEMSLHSNIEGELNVATGIETDINTLAEKLIQISCRAAKIQHGPPMPGEQKRSVLDPGLIAEKFGWRPHTSIDEGLQKTWEYFARQGTL